MVQARPRNVRTAEGLQLLRAAPAAEAFPRWVVSGVFWFPLVSLIALLASALVFRPKYDQMLREDWPVEWAQFAGCLFLAVVVLLLARPAVRQRQFLLAALLLLSAPVWFFLAGEEISWGQRVFGFATPEGFEGNRQAEANLHNFGSGFDPEAMFRYLQVVIGLTLAAVAVYAWRARPRAGSFWALVAPPLWTLPVFLVMPLYRLLGLFVPDDFAFFVRLQEWAELCQYAGLVIVVLGIYQGVQGRVAERRLLWVAGAVLAVTVAFAIATPFSGITPGNTSAMPDLG